MFRTVRSCEQILRKLPSSPFQSMKTRDLNSGRLMRRDAAPREFVVECLPLNKWKIGGTVLFTVGVGFCCCGVTVVSANSRIPTVFRRVHLWGCHLGVWKLQEKRIKEKFTEKNRFWTICKSNTNISAILVKQFNNYRMQDQPTSRNCGHLLEMERRSSWVFWPLIRLFSWHGRVGNCNQSFSHTFVPARLHVITIKLLFTVHKIIFYWTKQV